MNITLEQIKEAISNGAHAGNIVREVAQIAGGSGGGKPDSAMAGGKDISKIAEALEKAGVERTLERLENAELVLPVFDFSSPLDDTDLLIIEKTKNTLSWGVRCETHSLYFCVRKFGIYLLESSE